MTYLINPDTPKRAQVLKAVKKELDAHKYKMILVGGLHLKLADDFIFPGLQTVFVHDADSEKPADEEMLALQQKQIIYLDGEHNLQHILHSASSKFRTLFPAEILGGTISSLEESVRKCIEIAVTAVDRKAIPPGERIISIAGEGEEPDTAIVLEPSYSTRIIDTHIVRIVCYPYHKEF